MSEQRPVVTATGASRQVSPADVKKTEEELAKLKREKKAKFARVLKRGFAVDRLTVDLPPDIHGEWVPEDQVDRAKLLGFEIDTEYAKQRQLHPAGDGSARIA